MDFQHSELSEPRREELMGILQQFRVYITQMDDIMTDVRTDFGEEYFCTKEYALSNLTDMEERLAHQLLLFRAALSPYLGVYNLIGLPGESRLLAQLNQDAPCAEKTLYERQCLTIGGSWLLPFLLQIVHVINTLSREMDLFRGWLNDPEYRDVRISDTHTDDPAPVVKGMNLIQDQDITTLAVFRTSDITNEMDIFVRAILDNLSQFDDWKNIAFNNGNHMPW